MPVGNISVHLPGQRHIHCTYIIFGQENAFFLCDAERVPGGHSFRHSPIMLRMKYDLSQPAYFKEGRNRRRERIQRVFPG